MAGKPNAGPSQGRGAIDGLLQGKRAQLHLGESCGPVLKQATPAVILHHQLQQQAVKLLGCNPGITPLLQLRVLLQEVEESTPLQPENLELRAGSQVLAGLSSQQPGPTHQVAGAMEINRAEPRLGRLWGQAAQLALQNQHNPIRHHVVAQDRLP